MTDSAQDAQIDTPEIIVEPGERTPRPEPQVPPMIDVRDVTKVFTTKGSKGQDVQALGGINLQIPPGEMCILLGPSGCGKTTLLNLIAGFEKPTSGEIVLDGAPVTDPGPDRGFVFQDYALLPWKTVIKNIMFGLTLNGRSKSEAREIAQRHIKMVGLEGFENAYTHTLSGGMRQRVGIARALAYDPKVLLMDEPFGALDAQTRTKMQGELVEIWQQTNKTVVFVTHSVAEAVYLADRVVVMKARPGQVAELVDVTLDRPRDETDPAFNELRRHLTDLLDS